MSPAPPRTQPPAPPGPRNRPPARSPSRPPARPAPPNFEVVDPIWLAKALGLSFLAAVVCAWLTLCLLFYQGEWQLILHPSRTLDRTPAAANLAYEDVRFDAADTGQPRLTAWWVPAQSAAPPGGQPAFQPIARYAAYTVLFLHDGSQSLSATVPTLALLHRAGLNVFAIDYRGFGQSDASSHPTEARMAQDTAAALDYLTATRHIPAANIIPYGTGLGASLAANLALRHPQLPAVILANPDPDPTATAVATPPNHFGGPVEIFKYGAGNIVPIRLFFRERFDIATPLATLTTPKLLLAGGPDTPAGRSQVPALQALYHRAASPSLSVILPPLNYEADFEAALTRFLDQTLPRTPGAAPPAP